ncbi:hypothetical protein [Clostridium butyricum]|uniref:hypothetical protein n=1 Tax=Clostridium butyricum TaxID=1492 RepID=UPI002AB08DC5|nr:hypothetical protein [Clostridium butyricum]
MAIIFNNQGVEKEEELNFDKPLVYLSDSLISSMSYSGEMEKIKQSESIEKKFTEKLSQINGRVSLGLSNGKLKNAHIYSKDATTLDGTNRMCYIQQEENSLLVSEYFGNRGAKYSSGFRQLALKLRTANFKEKSNEKFIIEESNIDLFVEIINDLISEKINGCFELSAENDIDSITIKNKKNYFFKAYWHRKINKKNDGDFNKVEDCIKNIAKYIKECNDAKELEIVSEKMKNINDIIENKIKIINSLESI